MRGKSTGKAAAGASATTQDLSAGTKTDTGSMEGASTALASTSTMGLGTPHGRWDVGMDGYAILEALDTVPTQGQTLRLKVTATSVTGDPGGSNVALGVMLSTTTTPASGEGYCAAGFVRTGGSVNKAWTPTNIGGGIGTGATLTGSLTAIAEIQWGASGPLGVESNTYGATTGETRADSQAGNSGTWTAPCVGVFMQNANSPGTAEVVWNNVVVTSEIVG